jgi:hypothetical protein
MNIRKSYPTELILCSEQDASSRTYLKYPIPGSAINCWAEANGCDRWKAKFEQNVHDIIETPYSKR